MLDRIRRWLSTEPVRRAARTFLQVFAGLFVVSLTGWLDDVQQWASGGAPFPALSTLGSAAVSAVAAGLSAVTTGVHNWLEDRGVVRDRRAG